MVLPATECEEVESRGSCKCDKCRIHKTDKWLRQKQPTRFPMCLQFRKAYIAEDEPALKHLDEIFGRTRCLCCGYTLLHLAVSVASKDLVEYYLSRNHDVHQRTDNGETALHLACAIDDAWFAEQLLIAKSDVKAIDDLGCTPLQVCLTHNIPSIAILKVLLAHGARPNKLFGVGGDIEKSITKMINANMRNRFGVLPLYEAIYKADYVAAQQLLKDGACPNSLNCYRRTLLQVACYNRAVECAEALLNAGANVNDSDLEGRTALHYAIISESTEIVKLLLSSKCDLWLRDSDGYTALGMAALTNRLHVTNQLLDHGARCTELLLLEALERRCTRVALSILRRCYFRIHDTKLGRSMLYCAISTGQQEVVWYLESVGVKVAYEGSEDEEDDDVPMAPRCVSPVTETAVSARFASSDLVAYESVESTIRKMDNTRSPSSVPKTKNGFVENESVASCSMDYSVRKTSSYKTTQTTRKRTYVPRPQDMASNNAHHGKQSRYARVADGSSESKLRSYQQNKSVRARQKNRRGYQKRQTRKCIASDDRTVPILDDKEISSKHKNTAIIQSNSTNISSTKIETNVNTNVKLIVKSASKKSSKRKMNKNGDSFFRFNCRERYEFQIDYVRRRVLQIFQ